MRAIQPVVAGLSGLGSTMAAEQHAPARFAPLRSQRPGQELGLVVPSPTGPTGTRRCPRDDVDLGGIEPPAELFGKITGESAPITELQPDHQLFGQSDELCCCGDARRRHHRWRCNQCKSTTATQFDTGFPATSTTIDQHVCCVSRGCDSHDSHAVAFLDADRETGT